MSAQVFGVPDEVHVPDFDESLVNGRYSIEKDDEVREKFFVDLKAHLTAIGYTGKSAGEVVRWGRGDGYAEYMVASLRPLRLIHIPLGDAWQMDEIFLRGLTAKDVTDRIESERKLGELFGRKPKP